MMKAKYVLSRVFYLVWHNDDINYSPYKLKEIRELVDAYEAGDLEITEQFQ